MPHATQLSVLAVIVLWCAVSGAQQQPTAPGVPRIGGDVRPPVLLYRQEPEYSEEARIARLEGTVTVYVTIGEDGRAHDLRIAKSLGLGLDENAIAAVSTWQFTPGTKAGKPVAVQSTIEVNYRLMNDPREWHPERVAFTAPPGASLPSLRQAQFPVPAGLQDYASARLSFTVDQQGVPTEIQVDESSDPQWNDEVIALIREWRFQAALDHGVAVESRGFIDLTRGLRPPVAGAPPKKKQ